MSATARIFLLCSLLACAPAGGVLAQNPSPAGDANVAADRAQSDALTAEQREQARSLFEHAFALLQSGDLQAASLGFEQGLVIDPANTAGNLYMAETALRLNNIARARSFYAKVIALQPNSAEALKAQAVLKSLPVAATATPDPDALKADATNRMVLVVRLDAAAHAVADIIAAAKRNPGNVNVGCSPVAACVAADRFKTAATVEFSQIPYRRPENAINDLTLGQIDFAFVPMTSALQSLPEGKVRVIAVTGPTRSPNMAEIPTLSEAGIPGL